ncbi:MAG: hypothetical protein QXS38_00510 [Candidatus Pacearchaeota archaeon]
MKRLLTFGLYFSILIILIGFVSAECASDQIIMRLNTPNNAHGAIWSYGGYNSVICYSDLFSQPYSGDNPHTCNSDNSNLVLKLYASFNSHAASKDSIIYGEKVCHKGLSACETIPKSAEGTFNCPSQKYPIAYLYSLTNSHIYTSPIGANFVVCCKGASAPAPPPFIADACYQITTKENCESLESYPIAQIDPGCTPASGDKTICYCSWNVSNEVCEVKWESKWEGCSYKCVVDSIPETDCIENSQIVRLVARTIITDSNPSCASISIPVEASGCRSGSATVYCGRAEVQMPFFAMTQMFISIVIICIIYFIVGRRDFV